MLEPTELSMKILRLQTESTGKVVGGFTFIRLFLVPVQERVVFDRLVISEEGVRQLAMAT